jgi:hypothetical protein
MRCRNGLKTTLAKIGDIPQYFSQEARIVSFRSAILTTIHEDQGYATFII